jgi:transcriptional regulator with XRE-family HTH domain
MQPTCALAPLPGRSPRMARHSKEFARRFRELIVGKRQADVAETLEITQSYVGQVARGDARPGRALVERVIEKFGLPREEWLNLAGYGQANEDPEEALVNRAVDRAVASVNGAQRLFDGLVTLQEEHPQVTIPVPRMHGGVRRLTVEEAESILADMRDKIKRGLI